MDLLVLAGRIMFAGVFLYSAAGHFTRTTALAEYARRRGVPLPRLSTIAGGVLLLMGGLSVLLGAWADLGALLLAVFLAPTAVLMHGFWRETGDARAVEQTQFLKDSALAGASLILAAFFAYAGDDLGLTATGPLLRVR